MFPLLAILARSIGTTRNDLGRPFCDLSNTHRFLLLGHGRSSPSCPGSLLPMSSAFAFHLGWPVAILSDSPGDELKSRPQYGRVKVHLHYSAAQ